MIILGVDPGTIRIGYGLIKKEKNKLFFLKSGLIKISGKRNNLLSLESELNKILIKFKPDLAVVENLFFLKNKKTAFSVSQARGVIILTLEKQKIKILELTPLQVKSNLCGNGKADKKTVAKFVKLILNLKKINKIDDVTDALAMAIVGSSSLNIK